MTPTPEDIALANTLTDCIGVNVAERGRNYAAKWVANEIAAHTAPLRELAEIGRLAVEHHAAACAWAAGAEDDEALGSRAQHALTRAVDAIDAYLAKQEESK